jgi:hypothetical protein
MEEQTAIEWLISKLELAGYDLDKIPNIIARAKEMERQQIMDAFDEGDNREFYRRPQAQQYFKQTYGK